VKRYDKLVRDRIPEIIEAAGKRCTTRVLDDDEFDRHLALKLQEELTEYQQTGDVAELADLVEVIHALVERQGMGWDDFEAIRVRKRVERGGFTRRLLLCDVRPQ
jgi:predicted house-cleaning noncanonical NTP pyrophosphatase (MazG superfamily)